MAYKRAAFTLTADTTGLARATVHLPIPETPIRIVYLEAVLFDDSAATKIPATFSMYDSDVSDGEDFQIFAINGADIPLSQQGLDKNGAPVVKEGVVYPRTSVGVVNEAGISVGVTDYTRIPIRSNYLRCRMDGLASGDVYNVYAVYETAGDLRF